MIDLAILGVVEDWFFLRLELHPFLKGRAQLGTAKSLPFKQLVQIHAVLDMVDADQRDRMAEMDQKMRTRR